MSAALLHPGQGADERLVERALRLLATAEVALPEQADRARRRLAHWRTQSPAHECAHTEALHRWQALQAAAQGLRERWADPLDGLATPDDQALRFRPRRRVLLGLALAGVGVAGLAGGNAWWQWRRAQPLFAQTWRTGPRQLLRVQLPDGDVGVELARMPLTHPGTELTLSARSALRAALYRNRRETELLAGEARFDVAHDAARPFVVHTRAGRVEVMGTAFTVADHGRAVSVAVERGRVRFVPAAQPGQVVAAPPVELGVGEQITVRDGDPDGVVRRIAAADVGAWRSGWLVFDDAPLAEVVPAINAFRDAPLVLADAPTARLRLTGRFRATDERALLVALQAMLPLRTLPQADGSVRLEARP